MKEVVSYNKAIIKISTPFTGLPYAHALLIRSLITLADPTTGIVSNVTYQDLANLLTVTKAPGRKESGTPTKQTVRNYIQSIERECGDYFKVITEEQKLQFLFPELPKIVNKLLHKPMEVNTKDDNKEFVMGAEQHGDSTQEINTEHDTEDNTPNNAVKNNIYIINKQTNKAQDDICASKKSISDDFYPDCETVAIAQAKGYMNVTNTSEIKAFIQHNKTNKTQWANFNPVYLRWLERHAEYQAQQKQRTEEQLLRSTHRERYIHKKHQSKSALQTVSELHGIAIDSIWDSPEDAHHQDHIIEATRSPSMDETHGTLWSTFY